MKVINSILIMLMLVIPIVSSSKTIISIESGMSQYYANRYTSLWDDDYIGINKKGYGEGIAITFPFKTLNPTVSVDSTRFYYDYIGISYNIDISNKFYITNNNIDLYISPVIGYNHSSVEFTRTNDEQLYDFYRLGSDGGITITNQKDYINLNFSYIIVTPTGKVNQLTARDRNTVWKVNPPLDTYLENATSLKYGYILNANYEFNISLTASTNTYTSAEVSAPSEFFNVIPTLKLGASYIIN